MWVAFCNIIIYLGSVTSYELITLSEIEVTTWCRIYLKHIFFFLLHRIWEYYYFESDMIYI